MPGVEVRGTPCIALGLRERPDQDANGEDQYVSPVTCAHGQMLCVAHLLARHRREELAGAAEQGEL